MRKNRVRMMRALVFYEPKVINQIKIARKVKLKIDTFLFYKCLAQNRKINIYCHEKKITKSNYKYFVARSTSPVCIKLFFTYFHFIV